MNKLARLLPVVAGAGVVALSQITISPDGHFTLSDTDVSTPGSALLNLGESIFEGVIQFRPYLVGLIGVGILIKMISNMMGHKN